MRRRVALALDECLAALANGGVGVEECLAAHPEYANELRPLLELAAGFERIPQAQPAAAAVATGKAAMLAAVTHRRRSAVRIPRLPAGGRVRRMAALGLASLVLVIIGGLVAELAFPPHVARAATVVAQSGVVEVLESAGSGWGTLETSSRLAAGARIRTGVGGHVTLGIVPGATVDVASGSEVEIVEFRSRPSGRDVTFVLREIVGTTILDVAPGLRGLARYEIETPHARVQAQLADGGLHVTITVGERATNVLVASGRVVVDAAGSVVEVGPGEAAQAGGAEGAEPSQPRAEATPRVPEEPGGDRGSGSPSATSRGGPDAVETEPSDGTEGGGEHGAGGDLQGGAGTAEAPTPEGPVDETPRFTRTPEREATPKGMPQGEPPQVHEPTPQGPNPGSGGGADGGGGPPGGSGQGNG